MTNEFSMAARPYMRSAHIKRFRGLVDLRLDDLRRVTLIGGLNGAGKTTLLDSIFQFMDSLGPVSLVRSAIFRNLPPSISSIHDVNSTFGESSDSIFEFDTKDGLYEARLKWEVQNFSLNMSAIPVEVSAMARPSGNTVVGDGYTYQVELAGSKQLERHFVDQGGGIAINDQRPPAMKIPQAVYISRSTSQPLDLANRYSGLVQKRKKTDFIGILRLIAPQIDDLELLQLNQQPVLHAQVAGSIMPLSFVGDGLTSLASIIAAIISSPSGIVLLDEFDASIHYSKLPDVWRAIHEAAKVNDCQIIAATHSKESVLSAASTMSGSKEKDLIYYRLDFVSRRNIATAYSSGEILEAGNERWEVR